MYPAKVGGGRRVVALRVGTLSQRDRLIPRDQNWCRSAQSWLPQLPRIEKRDRQPVFDDKGDFGEKG